MSGYLYILEHEGVPGSIKIGRATRPIEEVLKPLNKYATVKCTHLWAVDWPKKLEDAIHRKFKEDKTSGDREYFNKSILCSLHLFIDAYLNRDRNVSRETARLLKATREKRPTRSDMTLEQRRLEEIDRANEASKVRREKEGIYQLRCHEELLGLLSSK